MGRGKGIRRLLNEALVAEAEAVIASERKAKARSKRRARCTCAAYPFPHRPAGGLCRHPDLPIEQWQGKAGQNRPAELRRRGLRKSLCRELGLHPIRDRLEIERRLPTLYAAERGGKDNT
jgi:hypothetical protein